MRQGIGLLVLLGFLAACSGGGGTAPFAESRTPSGLAERFYPPEGWAWCYVDKVPVDLHGDTTPQDGPIPRYV